MIQASAFLTWLKEAEEESDSEGKRYDVCYSMDKNVWISNALSDYQNRVRRRAARRVVERRATNCSFGADVLF